MSAAEQNKHSPYEGGRDPLAELEGFAKEGKSGSSLFHDVESAGETGIDTSILAEAALRRGAD